jgi:hypothetical protein
MTLRKTVSRLEAEIVKILPVLSRDFSLVKGPAVGGLVQCRMMSLDPQSHREAGEFRLPHHRCYPF